MSRAPAAEVIETKPSNNIYTALVIIAFLAVLAAFIVLYLKAGEVFAEGSKGLFG